MQFTTEQIKGSPEYRVVDEDGTVRATSHCVNVPAGLFTVVVDGKWSGVMAEADAVAMLQGTCNSN
jgi:hypothetical protein